MMEKIRQLEERVMKLFTHTSKELTNEALVNPARDWKIMILTSALLMVLCAAWAGYVYVSIKNPQGSGGDGTPQKTVKLSQEKMDEVVRAAAKRAELHGQLESAGPSVVDPSR